MYRILIRHMGDMKFKFNIRLAVFYAVFSAASAPAQTTVNAPAPVTFTGQYSFSWAGISLGRLALRIEETPERYTMHLGVVSAGIVNLFTRHENDTVADGRRIGGRYLPHRYESYYKTKKKPRHIRLVFDEKGAITEELNEPPENRALRPEVTASQKDGAVDPLTGLLVMRSFTLTFPAFDAKRLYQVNAEDKGVESFNALGTQMEAHHFILTRTPLAGLTEKEKDEYKAGEPPLHFYFSHDARRIPLGITMPVFMGSVKGVLVRECATWDECKVN